MANNRLSKDKIKEILAARGFSLVDEYIGVDFKHKVKCHKHGEIHSVLLNHILYKRKRKDGTYRESGLWCCRQAFFSGQNSPQYNKNMPEERRKENEKKRRDPKWRSLRNKIKIRDYNTCQCCLSSNIKLNVHHLINWTDSKYRFDWLNAITLCEECHKELHKTYGYNDTSPLKYVKFINSKGIIVNHVAEDILQRIEDFENTQGEVNGDV